MNPRRSKLDAEIVLGPASLKIAIKHRLDLFDCFPCFLAMNGVFLSITAISTDALLTIALNFSPIDSCLDSCKDSYYHCQKGNRP